MDILRVPPDVLRDGEPFGLAAAGAGALIGSPGCRSTAGGRRCGRPVRVEYGIVDGTTEVCTLGHRVRRATDIVRFD